jgi:hypothetical protein
MNDQAFRDRVIEDLSTLKTLAQEQKNANAFVYKEHCALKEKVDGIQTRVNWFSGVGATLIFALTSWLGLHRGMLTK